MSRDPRIYLRDMLTCCEKVSRFAGSSASEDFTLDELRFDAILRNLEIMGEAAKRVPDDIRKLMPSVDWRGLAGLRDVLIHSYSGVEAETIVDIVLRKVPPLEAELRRYLGATG